MSYFTLANRANSSENLKQTKTSYRGKGRDTEHSQSDGASEETKDDGGSKGDDPWVSALKL